MGAVCRVLVLAVAAGSVITADAAAQTFTSPPGTTRGLFGGDVAPNPARSTQRFAVWFDLGGGYDANLVTSEVPSADEPSGYAATALGAFQYWRGRTTRSLEAIGRLYRNNEFATGLDARGGDLELIGTLQTGERGGFGGRLRVANESARLFGAFGPEFASPGPTVDDGITVADVSPPTGVVEDRWLSLGGAVNAYRNWTPRQRSDVQYTQVHRRPLEGEGLFSDTGQAAFNHQWNFSPSSGLLFSYRYDQVGQEFAIVAVDPVRTQAAEGGFRYNHRITPLRTFTFSFQGGTTYVMPTASSLGPIASHIEPSGSVSAAYTLTARWSLTAAASRSVTVLPGMSVEPFANDFASLSVTGVLARRLTLTALGTYSQGSTLGAGPGSFSAQIGTATLQYGFQYGGVFIGYGRYYHRVRDVVGPPDGVVPRFDRYSVRTGVTIWLPLFGSF